MSMLNKFRKLFINSVNNTFINKFINNENYSGTIHVYTDKPEDFSSNSTNKMVINDTTCIKKTGKFTVEKLVEELDSLPANSYVVLNNITDICSYYDKGNRRFVNYIYAALNTSHNIVFTYDAAVINSDMIENIDKIFKRHSTSQSIVDKLRRSDALVSEFIGFDQELQPINFYTTESFIKNTKENHSEKLSAALAEISRYLNIHTFNITDLEILSTKSDERFDFKYTRILAKSCKVNLQYLISQLNYIISNNTTLTDPRPYSQFGLDYSDLNGLCIISREVREINKCYSNKSKFFSKLHHLSVPTAENYVKAGFSKDLETVYEVMRYAYKVLPEGVLAGTRAGYRNLDMRSNLDEYRRVIDGGNKKELMHQVFTILDFKGYVSPYSFQK